MLKSNLVNIFRTFSSKELKEFSEYVQSPFFNKNESTIKLFNYMRKFSPDFGDKRLEKEYTYKKIFPEMKYNDGFMRTIMFNLMNLAEQYIAYVGIKNEEFTEKKYMLSELYNRDLGKMFEKTMREVTSKLSKKRIKDVNYYFDNYSIEEENLSYLSSIQFEKNEKFISITGIENIFNNLTYFYLIRILKYYVYVLNTSSIYQVEFKTKLVEDLLFHLNPEIYKNIPLIKIYFDMVMLHLKEDEENYFYELKSTIAKLDYPISDEDFSESFINLENYCKRKMRKGDNKYARELFEIYKMELKKKVYTVNKKMPHKLYRGIIENGLRLNEFDWVKNFIEDYKNELLPELKENTYNYCLALFNFTVGNYEESLKIASKVKYHDVFQKLELKSLTAALFYELDMQEQLFSSMDSFRHIISNNTLMKEERKEHYLKFLKHLKKLIKLKNDFSQDEYDELKKKMKIDKPLINGDWLMEKVEELGKTHN
jgi:hypothetical protein